MMAFAVRGRRDSQDVDSSELQDLLQSKWNSEEKRNDNDDGSIRSHDKTFEDVYDGSNIDTTRLDDMTYASRNNAKNNMLRKKSVLPLSMKILRHTPFAFCCECTIDAKNTKTTSLNPHENTVNKDDVAEIVLADYGNIQASTTQGSAASPMVVGPMLFGGISHPKEHALLEQILSEYIRACQFYGCGDRINAGVLTTIRFSLPSMRVRGSFHDADMLALSEILLKYANGPLRYIRRLDFSIVSSKTSTAQNVGRTPGFGSHGALTLSKVLQTTKYINEILVEKNRIGSYGATAIFIACSQNPTIKKIAMRFCYIGERGGLTFAEFLCPSTECGLVEADLSCNALGYSGCTAIENALTKRHSNPKLHPFQIDLEGNLVFQEIMNSVTHGLGVILAIAGSYLLLKRVEGQSMRHTVSCTIYSGSLMVLYLVSTLYHSFFSLKRTQWVFQILDKCAIYVLIAGSYTPFLQIVLGHKKIWSVYLLAFLWICCVMGIWVEFAYPYSALKGNFSLAMYLAMGWSCVVCLPEVVEILPQSMFWMFLGGIAYTGGVPFFLRSNNLDHAIWHLFVLAGSIFHWCGIYFHVASLP